VTITLRDQEWLQLVQEHVQSTQPGLLANQKDFTLALPDWLGKGYKRNIFLGHGLSLTLHRLRYQEDIIFLNRAMNRNCFEFMFVTAAHIEINRQLHQVTQQVYLLDSALPDCRAVNFAGQDYVAIDVHINTTSLASMIGEHESNLPRELCQMVAGRRDRTSLPPLSMTPKMQRLLQQIWQCPYLGLTRSLFLEAKSLELIALYLEALQTQANNAQTKLQAYEIDCIHQARIILQQNLQTPPSLRELARQVGLNDFKLKQGFREVLDSTVFGYVTQQRMERACQLLMEQRTVAAVAQEVGYSSPTAFSSAFRRKYGVTPKAYQLQQRFGA